MKKSLLIVALVAILGLGMGFGYKLYGEKQETTKILRFALEKGALVYQCGNHWIVGVAQSDFWRNQYRNSNVGFCLTGFPVDPGFSGEQTCRGIEKTLSSCLLVKSPNEL